MKKIGFNNYAKYSKYEVWKKFGFCPPYTTLKQRKKILNGELDPYSFYSNGMSPEGFEFGLCKF